MQKANSAVSFLVIAGLVLASWTPVILMFLIRWKM